MRERQDSMMDCYLAGERLYGDDLGPQEISAWYADEREGYAELGAADRERYRYQYHALNWHHGFSRLPKRPFEAVLGLGSAYGDELRPVLDGARQVTIVDPSKAFVQDSVFGVPARYIEPGTNGALPLGADSYDLVCGFGVLHHIPNVSFVLRELARVLKPGGYALLREPIVSMGDWRLPRNGLTKHERGIPHALFHKMVVNVGLTVKRSAFCDFALTPRLFSPLSSAVYNSRAIVWVDAILARLFAWNANYHPRNFGQRLRPASLFVIASKPE